MSNMGLGRVELPTSRLSGVRSNHLSYRPFWRTPTQPSALPYKITRAGLGSAQLLILIEVLQLLQLLVVEIVLVVVIQIVVQVLVILIIVVEGKPVILELVFVVIELP